MACTTRFEREARRLGHCHVAGLDEAGRGCLFGPVFAAAVILDPARPIRGLDDSKVLDAPVRHDLANAIRERAVAWSVASVEARIIDRINIYQASRLAMKLALDRLQPPPDFLLVDALTLETTIPQRAIIHGDALSRSIAAASILAKTERDMSMADWDRRYPGFGFQAHKGYGTPQHLDALNRLGPTPDHRYSFLPVREAAGLIPRQMDLFSQEAS